MRKIFKKIIILFFVLFLFASFFTMCFGMRFDLNGREPGKEYEHRDFVIPGIVEDVIFRIYDKVYFNGENDYVSNEQKNKNNYLIIGVSGVLIIYWIVLLFIFEKEESSNFYYENIDDITTLKKYNPLIAGCLTQNRQALPRDVIAVVLNLIQKDYIKMEMVHNLKNEKETYTYLISENKEKKEGLDKVEKYVINWIFGFYEEEEVDLIKRLENLSERKDYLKNLKNLRKISDDELHKIGANISKVPYGLRVFNIILAIFTVLISVFHIINNGIGIHIYQSTIWLFCLIVFCALLIVPVVALAIHLVLFLIVLLKKLVKSTADRYSGKQIVKTSALILTFMFILIAIVFAIVPSKYICLDIFMIGIAILIVKTDNLMTKHNDEVLNDYYALNEIKYKIEEYSLIKDEQINYMKLWDEYLIYAVAFGIPIPIVTKIKGTYQEDEDIRYLLKAEALYYVCKAYLEKMWYMKFNKKSMFFNWNDLFGIQDNNDGIHKF